MKTGIEKGNVLIALFMGMTLEHDGKLRYAKEDYAVFKPEQFNYHRYWDSIIPVLEKIRGMGKMVTISFWSELEMGCECKIYNSGVGEPSQENECENAIEAVWETVIDFIEYHNAKP